MKTYIDTISGETLYVSRQGSYYKDKQGNIAHRVDGPAFTGPVVEYWMQNGTFHRLDGPAIIWTNGDDSSTWYINGVALTKRSLEASLEP